MTNYKTMDKFLNIPNITPETCPIVADISVYPLDHSSHDIAAGHKSIMTTLYSNVCEDDDMVYFYATFPGFDETMQINCNGSHDLGGKIIDHIYQQFKETSSWSLFRLIRVPKDTVKNRTKISDDIYHFTGKLFIIHHPKNNSIIPTVHYFVKRQSKNTYRLLQLSFAIDKNLLDEIIKFRKLDLERYFFGNPYCKTLMTKILKDF